MTLSGDFLLLFFLLEVVTTVIVTLVLELDDLGHFDGGGDG